MVSKPLSDRIAVCSWSLDPATPQELVSKVKATGLQRVQLALDPLRQNPTVWNKTAELCQSNGTTIISGMFGCVGEDYTTIETIHATGGLVPNATWEQNLKNIQSTATLARQLNIKLVTFHAGHLPEDLNDPNFNKMQQRLGQVADLFAASGINLALETGQESPQALRTFLQKLNRPNLGINFDPANLILYGKGDPVEAVRVLRPWIRQLHVKDARRPKTPGAWGDEVVVGTGEVNWPVILAFLRDTQFNGNLCIEREAGNNRITEIRAAHDYILSNK